MSVAPVTAPDVDTDSGAAPGASPRRCRWWRAEWLRAMAAIMAGTAVLGAHAAFYGNWLIDDAGITFAYARSVSEGLGPVLQPGAEPVEGFSNPLWLLVLVAGRLLGLFDQGTIAGIPDYVLFPKSVALLCCAGILTACYAVAARIVRYAWLVTLAVGLGLAAIPSFVIWSFSGLENPLYALIIVGLAAMLVRAVLDDRLLTTRVAGLAGALAAAAALTRPDGLIYAGAYPLLLLLRLPREVRSLVVRRIAVSIVAFAVPMGAYLCWRWATFGQLLATPAVAKGQTLPEPADITRVGELVAYAGAPAVLLFTMVVALVFTRPVWWRPGLVALLVPLGLAVAAYSVLNRDWMSQYRFATPIWALAVPVAVLSTVELLRRGRGRLLLVSALVLTLTGSTAAFAESAREFRHDGDVTLCNVADRSGRVFNAYAGILGLGHASLLNPDLGGAALTSRLTLVDLAGLGEPRIAEFQRDRDMAGLRDYVFDEVRPTFIHLRPPWGRDSGIPWEPRLARDYHRVFQPARSGPRAGDWVRRDAVPDAASLAVVRDYARTTMAPVDRAAKSAQWPLRSCGDTLRRGQTAIGRT